MGFNAVYIAVDIQLVEDLWQLGDADFRERFLELEDAALRRLNIGKLWDSLHCTLTGESARDPIEGNRLSEVVVGVWPRIFDDDDYSVFVSVIENSDLPHLLTALEPFDRQALSAAIDVEQWAEKDIYPLYMWEDDRDEVVTELDEALASIRRFFQEAGEAGQHVLATIL